jgi:hypothetical protein
MADTEKTAQLEQRAQKKAARRAAFIQDIAEAVYSLGVQRQNEIEAKKQQQEIAAKAARQAKQDAESAQYDAQHPIEAAYYKVHPTHRKSFMLSRFMPALILRWALDNEILPEGTKELPGIEAQYLALASHQQMASSD